LRYAFKSMERSLYPGYHTVHDTFYWQKTFNDPHFKAHLLISQISGRIVLEAADIPLLPFNLTDLEKAIKGDLKVLERDYTSLLQKGNVTLKHLAREV